MDWNAPANNGDTIRRYNVHYRQGAGQWKDVGHNNASTAVLISELTNGNEYQVRVRAVNNRGNGRWSPVSTMKAGLPAKTVYARTWPRATGASTSSGKRPPATARTSRASRCSTS